MIWLLELREFHSMHVTLDTSLWSTWLVLRVCSLALTESFELDAEIFHNSKEDRPML